MLPDDHKATGPESPPSEPTPPSSGPAPDRAARPHSPPASRSTPAGPRQPPIARAKPVSSSLRPIKPQDFGSEQARHLLWRAGFGGTPAQIRTLVEWGSTKSVDHLLSFESIPFDEVKADLFDKNIMRPATDENRGELARARKMDDEAAVARLRMARQEAQRLDREQMAKVQRWWLTRMIETPRPLEEKMTLFWHGHFATSYRTIEDSYHMFAQNQLFRTHAVGNFGELLGRIIRDPAMIAYLNNNDSRKGKPNENLARELMELFSLGVGNYSEKDIKEGARALTGYTFEDDDFVLNRRNHDTGVKNLLGRSGPLDGDEFVAAILQQPACSRFICAKLYRFFCADCPSGNQALDAAAPLVIDGLAGLLGSGGFRVKPVLRTLFLSEHFYQPSVMTERIKSPVELVVGVVRSLSTPARDLGTLLNALNLMGQNLFYPPSVKGWDGGRSWINTATLFIRQNISCFLLTGRTPYGFDALSKIESYNPAGLLQELRRGRQNDAEPSPDADELLRFALGRARPHNRDLLLEFVAQRGGRLTDELLIPALLLVTSMPEFQLC